MTIDDEDTTQIARRRLLVGAGVAALAGTGLLSAETAQAATGPGGDGAAPQTAQPQNGSPITTSIASTPKSGYTYRSVCMYDFEPFNPAAQKTWGGQGTYSGVNSSAMRATCEVPAGALLREVEFYISNNTAAAVTPGVYLYAPGTGTIFLVVQGSVPVNAGAITATTVVVPSTAWGPYPSGARLLASLTTPTDATVQINGARFGFTQGVASTGLLDTPVRAYDSRTTGGKLATGSTRTITLPSSVVVPGVTGVLVNVTAVGAQHNGFLKVYSGAASAPAASAINFFGDGSAIANAMSVEVSASRTIKVYASTAVHVVVDITGTIS